ncbi:carboxypeptidase-like regulatory domain-containing protein [Flavobacterium okayamense]|uniref:CarboxypepD_reg-like domain-containing protein n=1 Tax=Flavobacterium okayamense TaxID=2830782 RepID=A0ABN6HYQ9_9FLAO|nr:carboxypeptidase-like regulatory domain-containing protein [Flavobacterium okayamense]BCY27398.1 hypothetical protein KK2020170_02660 [Flavobacterium okayamense]
MSKIFFYIGLLFCVTVFSQDKEREVLRGQIVADSMDVENITILNVTTNIGSVSDVDGFFSINVKAKDTLVFQGLSFLSQKYVLTESDFLIDDFKIKLEIKVNELDEVIVTPSSLTGILEVDTKKINVYGLDLAGIDVLKLSPDEIRNTKPLNPVTNSNFSPLMGVDFKALFGMFSSKKKKEKRKIERIEKHENEQWERKVMSKSFHEHLMARYSHNFFKSNLNIKNEDLVSFVFFAEPTFSEMAKLLKYENEIQLVEYLVKKSKEFNSNKNVQNDTNVIDEK